MSGTRRDERGANRETLRFRVARNRARARFWQRDLNPSRSEMAMHPFVWIGVILLVLVALAMIVWGLMKKGARARPAGVGL